MRPNVPDDPQGLNVYPTSLVHAHMLRRAGRDTSVPGVTKHMCLCEQEAMQQFTQAASSFGGEEGEGAQRRYSACARPRLSVCKLPARRSDASHVCCMSP